MPDELLTMVDAEIRGWPGIVVEERGGEAIIYWLGKRQIGHIHHDGVADLQFPRVIHDGLIAAGRAAPHRGGFAAVVSYGIRLPEDVPGAIELFRISYDRISQMASGARR